MAAVVIEKLEFESSSFAASSSSFGTAGIMSPLAPRPRNKPLTGLCQKLISKVARRGHLAS